jgi:hypothetical protein
VFFFKSHVIAWQLGIHLFQAWGNMYVVCWKGQPKLGGTTGAVELRGRCFGPLKASQWYHIC